jgi:YfiH family protein
MRKHAAEYPDMEYLVFPGLAKEQNIAHMFTTRLGGLSTGIYGTMNLSFTRGDDPKCVTENFRRVTKVFNCGLQDVICTKQTHTTNIRLVTEQDRGADGQLRPSLYEDVDGLITNTPGLLLAAFFADCVPLLFWDPIHQAIGLAHAGWRGTASRIGEKMVSQMREAFGTQPKVLRVGIGPSICKACYEVGEDVAATIREALNGKCEGILYKMPDTGEFEGIPDESPSTGRWKGISDESPGTAVRSEQKYKLDLWKANERILCQAGVMPQQIEVTDICTCHNPDYLFSHRARGEKRGNFGAFLMIH